MRSAIAAAKFELPRPPPAPNAPGTVANKSKPKPAANERPRPELAPKQQQSDERQMTIDEFLARLK